MCDCPSWLSDGRDPAHCLNRASSGATCGHANDTHQ